MKQTKNNISLYNFISKGSVQFWLAAAMAVLVLLNLYHGFQGNMMAVKAVALIIGSLSGSFVALGLRVRMRRGLPVLAAVTVVFACLYRILSNGAALTYNDFSARIGETFGRNLKLFVITENNAVISLAVFSLCLAFYMAFVLQLLQGGRIRKIFFWVIVLVFGFFNLGIELAYVDLFTGLLIAVILWYVILGNVAFADRAKNGSRRKMTGQDAFAKAPVTDRVILVVLTVIVLGVTSVGGWQQKDTGAAQRKTQFITALSQKVYGHDASIDGNLAISDQIAESDEVNLQVTLSKPAELYLKGFVGTDLEGDCTNGTWTATENQKYSGTYLEMEDWLLATGYDPLTASGMYGSYYDRLTGDDSSDNLVDVTVKHVNADAKYLYVPASMLEASADSLDKRNRDINLQNHFYGKLTEYQYSCYVWDEEELYSQDTNAFLRDYTEGDEELCNFSYGEYNYRRFVKETYLTEPDSIKTQYQDALSDYQGNLTSAIATVRAALAADGLTDTYQAASLGTMLFRQLSIPARYVEGYYISADRGTDVSLTNADMHAWCEVYLDGMGWIPVEVTPGFYDDLTVEQQEQETKEAPEEVTAVVSTADGSQDQTKEAQSLWSVLQYVLLAGFFVIILLLIIYARHLYLWHNKNQDKRLRYYKKVAARMLKRKGKMEDEMPVELWRALQAQRFGGQPFDEVALKLFAQYLGDLKKEKGRKK